MTPSTPPDGRYASKHFQWAATFCVRTLGGRTESFDKDVVVYNNGGTRNLHASVANTNVINHAAKTLALVESSLPYQITNELETLGVYDFAGKR